MLLSRSPADLPIVIATSLPLINCVHKVQCKHAHLLLFHIIRRGPYSNRFQAENAYPPRPTPLPPPRATADPQTGRPLAPFTAHVQLCQHLRASSAVNLDWR